MNLPNKLTVSRFVLTVIFLIAIFLEFRFHETVALVVFIAASLTDFYDGKIARRDKLITNFGILMDPLADKILVCSAFIAFVGVDWMPAWMVVIIVARELAITGLRLLALSKQVVLAAEGYGKHKTISQIVAIIAVLTQAGYPDWGYYPNRFFGFSIFGHAWVDWVAELSQYLAVALTLLSGGIYLWRNRKMYLDDL